MLRMGLAALALVAMVAKAEATVITADQAANGLVGAAGLNGTYYQAGNGSTNVSIARTLSVMSTAAVTGTFTSTSINYSGNDTSTITSLLGGDGSSYSSRGTATSGLSDTILDLNGYLYVAAAGTYSYSLNHDDSAQLKIANQIVISRDCCGIDTASVTFNAAGYYAIDVVYSNTIYNGGTGGDTFSLTQNNAILTSANLVKSVPEPATLALLGLPLVGIALLRKRGERGVKDGSAA